MNPHMLKTFIDMFMYFVYEIYVHIQNIYSMSQSQTGTGSMAPPQGLPAYFKVIVSFIVMYKRNIRCFVLVHIHRYICTQIKERKF
jgi:hypothetical protein